MYSKLEIPDGEDKRDVRGSLLFQFAHKYQRPSFLLHKAKKDEKEFLECVSRGDVAQAKHILNTNKGLNINCTDFQEDSALHIALKKNDEDMVAFLLSRKELDVMDCALHAIKLNQPTHVNLILDKLKSVDPSLEYSPCIDSSDFPDYLTPLMLAAQCGHRDIIELLTSRGHPIIMPPHQAKCVCDECVNMLKEKDPLTVSQTNLEIYKAISNPAYILHVSPDPILTVFLLVVDLREMAARHRIYLRMYEELIEESEKFAAELIGFCRTSDEVKIILNETLGSDLRGAFIFPRLILAVDYKQKYFVAKTNVQEVLENEWIGDWYEWRGYSDKRRTLYFLGRIFMLPLLCIVCVFLPKSEYAKFYSIPLNRMLSSVASYFIFLGLLYWESDRDKQGQTRYDIQYHTGWQLLIFIFVISHIINSFRMWTLQGTVRFFAFKWNWYDLATQLMFTLTFAFWICALITLDWQPDLERKYWHYLNPQLLAEGCFCIGTVMAYMRLLLLVQIHDTLGPMQVSLGKMTKDFSQFFVIFVLVIGSFNAGMCRLYHYYDGMVQIDPETKAESRQESSFVSAYDTFKMLFWGLFGMSSQDGGSVVIENLPSEGGELESINSHEFTQAVGYTLFAVYTVLNVIFLLNILIAVMSNTFQMVTDNVDVEWIFGRTEVYLAYMSQTVLPSPLNFIPAGVGVNAFSGFFRKIFSKSDTYFPPEQEIPEVDQPLQSDTKFDELMEQIIKRYFSSKEEEEEKGENNGT